MEGVTFLRGTFISQGKLEWYLSVHITNKNLLESNPHFSGTNWVNLRRY